MRYLSVCSGIEAASVAWESLSWTPVAFAEIEKFPSKVLAHHYPGVANLGDMTKFREWDIERDAVDILVGGTPCQSFSVAGLRKGLDDPRGNLALTFIAMVDHYRPEWVIWENVPGVLSSSGGRDFGSFLGALGQLGYGFAYRVLDAQHFGVPQRRRRVFVIAHSSGDSRRAAEILFEPESLSGNHKTSRAQGQGIADASITGTVSSKWAKGTGGPAGDECYNLVPVMYEHRPSDSRVTGPVDPSPTIAARWGTGGGNTPLVGQPIPIQDVRPIDKGQMAAQSVAYKMAVRRLTPTECERLQGFPDGYTDIIHYKCCGITFRLDLGKYGCSNCNGQKVATLVNTPDSSRYVALGNSMAVPVMRWIGSRIALAT